MNKDVEVKFSTEALQVFQYLANRSVHSKVERSLFNAITRKIELIKSNPLVGDNIAKVLIPRAYRDKYLVKNLYRVELPNFWRMLYTLTDEELKIIAFVVDVVDHKGYNERFGYKN